MDIKAIILLSAGIAFFSNSPSFSSGNLKDKISRSKLLKMVNSVRQSGYKCGGKMMPPVAPVVWNDKLAKSAYRHSKDMHSKKYFSHKSKNGEKAGDRIRKVGYSWRTYSENIAWGQSSEEAVMRSWLNSAGHCKNIMKESVQHMGVGKSGPYWTQIFAAEK